MRLRNPAIAAVLATTLSIGCNNDRDGNDDNVTGTGSSTTEDADTSSESPGPGTLDPTQSSNTADPDTGEETSAPSTTDMTGVDDTTTEGPAAGLPFFDDFEHPEGGPWADHWEIVGTAVIEAVIVGGRGRLHGMATTVARIVNRDIDATDVELLATVEYDNWATQGFGFYGRQNGGAVAPQPPFGGAGYSVYCEGQTGVISVWRELDGIEQQLTSVPRPPVPAGEPHRVRLQIEQSGNSTMLRAKMWRVGDAEPGAWDIEHLDDTPELQNVSGGLALDVYNYSGTGSVHIDDIEVHAL